MAWDLLIDRSDLARTSLVEVDPPEPAPGQVRLRVDRVGMTANNVTYAVFGDAMHYWDFFPAKEPHGLESSPAGVDGSFAPMTVLAGSDERIELTRGSPLSPVRSSSMDQDGVAYGRVPLWGFAEVEASTVPDVVDGTRLYGYLPTSSHVLVAPAKVDAKGFRDASPHRQHLPAPYNGLTTTTGDLSYAADEEDLQVLYRPLFMTSFVLADFLTDNGCFGAEAVVISSASSKTSYGTAFLLDDVHRIGLTSEGNRTFTEGLGCYDQVVTYDEVDDLATGPAVYIDVAGDATLRRRVHERLVPVHSAVVGASHHDAAPELGDAGDLPGGPPTFFFAPDQMRKRYADWGPNGVETRYAEAWSRFAPVVASWVDVVVGHGPEGLESAWLQTLAGDTPPRTGLVVEL